MNLLNHSLAALAAFVLTIGSIGAIVTVPSAHAAAPGMLQMHALA